MRRLRLSYFSLVILISPGFVQENFTNRLARAAVELTHDQVQYDPTYYRLSYPNGDVPEGKGVCTDVIIRAYRKLDIDLQKEVHEDMKQNFVLYPRNWGLRTTDKNIDHRRVPNLVTYFSRFGSSFTVSQKGSDYKAGDIVTWDLGRGVTHIGIVADRRTEDGSRPLIVHNIGNGQELSDCLFLYTITGHYRYTGKDPD